MRSRVTWEGGAVLALLVSGAILRFAGIAHDLDYRGPFFDESNNFVDPALRMWREGTANPGAYQGYAGFFNWLILVPVAIGDRLGGQAGAYLAARSVGALAGLSSIVLAHRVARRLFGGLAGVVAAGLMTFSRGEVNHAHNVTPDLLLVAAMLGLFLVLEAASDARRAFLAGALVGAATAVKYSGLLLAPGLTACIFVAARRPWRMLAWAGAAALVTFAAAAPYALTGLGRDGILVGALHYYFDERPPGVQAASGFAATWSIVALNIGWTAVVIAALALLTQPWRRWMGPFVLVLSATLVLSRAQLLYPRHVLLVSAATSLLAGGGAAGLLKRLKPGPVGVAATTALLAVLMVPTASRSFALLGRYLKPSPTRQLEAWIRARGAHGVALSSWRFPSGVDGLELRSVKSLRAEPRGLVGEYDFVISSFPGEIGPEGGLRELARFAPPDDPGSPLLLLGPSAETLGRRRPAPTPTSDGACLPSAGHAWDGNPSTSCSVPAGASLEGTWTSPVVLKRVEVRLASEPRVPLAFKLAGLTSEGWSDLDVVLLRPTRPRLQRRPWGQVLVLAQPAAVRAVRITLSGGASWDVADVLAFEDRAPD